MEKFFIFLFGILLTIAINHFLLAFSKNLGIRGEQIKQVRWAVTSKPSLGGFAFYIVFLGVMAFLGTQNYQLQLIKSSNLLGIFLAVSVGFFVGFADDTYNTNPFLKFIGQFLCAIIVFISDIQIHITPSYPIVNFIFTSLWVVGIMNSINMLDNMDGITASVSIVILLGLISIVIIGAEILDLNIVYILLAVVASLVGFLYHNWSPAKMYMGDAGSQFLGIFLAVFSIVLIWNVRDVNGTEFQFRQFVLPALLFIIPLIDTITVTFRRLMKGQSPFIGGKDHTTHHLVYFGLKERSVAGLYILINSVSVIIFLYNYYNRQGWNYMVTMISALFFVIIFVLVQGTYVVGLRKNKLKNKLPILNDFERKPQSTFENHI